MYVFNWIIVQSKGICLSITTLLEDSNKKESLEERSSGLNAKCPSWCHVDMRYPAGQGQGLNLCLLMVLTQAFYLMMCQGVSNPQLYDPATSELLCQPPHHHRLLLVKPQAKADTLPEVFSYSQECHWHRRNA